MEKLTSLDQLKVGTKLKIVAESEKYCMGSATVKELIKMWNEHGDGSLPSAGPKDTEILLNKRKNIYFSMNKYLMGKSWVTEAFVLTAKN